MGKNRTGRKKSQGRGNVREKGKSAGRGKGFLLDALDNIRQSLYEVCVVAGLEVLQAMLREDQEELCGPRYEHRKDRQARRHGSASGEVVLGGRRVAIERPRVRSVDGREIPLPSYEHFSDGDSLTESTLSRILAGVRTRSYEGALEPLEGCVDARGASKSAVSRRFVAATHKQVEACLSRPLDDLNLVVLMLDGLAVAGHTILVALGIDASGKKHILGAREGSTENSTVCRALLADLVERGISTDQSILAVIDGAKALRKAVRDVFGRKVLVQRCQLHKIRNVLEHLPKNKHAYIRKTMNKAYNTNDAPTAKATLLTLIAGLEEAHPGAASSLREGLDDTLTVLTLSISNTLRTSLRSTNPIESTLSTVRSVCRNVKRWRGGKMVLRWTVTGLREAEKRFRRLRGMKDMPQLVMALRAFDQSETSQVA
jgi:transposase-like protein